MFTVKWRESRLDGWKTLRVYGSEKDLNEVVSALKQIGGEVETIGRAVNK